MAKRTVLFISDRTGITVQNLGHSLLTQFPGVEVERVNLPFIDSEEKMQAVLQRIERIRELEGRPPVIFASLVDVELEARLQATGARIIDFFQTFLPTLEQEFGVVSSHKAGYAHGIGDAADYARRVEAVNFALSHDDGLGLRSLGQADLILVGVSRSGKTPTSLYLALQFGIRTANYPLTEEDFEHNDLPKSVQGLETRIFGLSIQPERLHQIRSERRPDSDYSALRQCYFEVHWAERVFQAKRIPFVHTTVLSIEELAVTIINRMGLERRVF